MIRPNVRLIIIYQGKLLVQYNLKQDIYFYPGGGLEAYETLPECATREVNEELGKVFTFQKLLYLREYIDPQEKVHYLEHFILGQLNDYDIAQESLESHLIGTHENHWLPLNNLPDNLLPNALTPTLLQDYQVGFPNQCQYLGKL